MYLPTADVEIPEATIWSRLTELSTTGTASSYPGPRLVISPRLYGERHAPDLTTSLSGLDCETGSMQTVFRAMCEGLVNNLHQMMPQSLLIESGIQRLVLSGSVVRRQPHVSACVEKAYAPLTVVPGTDDDASLGAALVAAEYLHSL